MLLWRDTPVFGEERPQWEQTLRNFPGGSIAIDFLRKQVYCRLWRFAWLDQDELHYLRYLEQFIALSREASRDKSLRKIDPLVDELGLNFQNRGIYDGLRYYSAMSFGALSRVLNRALRAETERSLVLAAIALKRYELRHGGLPESLNATVPEFLAAVPTDYMDGQPLRFRRQPDGGFVLYSVGEDGRDDAGDTSLRPDKTNVRGWWDRKDLVWPAPASEAEVEDYRAKAGRN